MNVLKKYQTIWARLRPKVIVLCAVGGALTIQQL
jgi:hypothetical protein